MTLRSRSCVIGRGVATFSICRAIALASETPTQIGSTRVPSLSRRMTIGMLVAGSIISVLTVISICITPSTSYAVAAGRSLVLDRGRAASSSPRRLFGFAPVIRTGTIVADQRRLAAEIDDGVAAGAAGQLPVAPPAVELDQDRLDAPDGRLVELPLNPPLQRLQRDDPARLLLLRHVVWHPLERQRVRPRSST